MTISVNALHDDELEIHTSDPSCMEGLPHTMGKGFPCATL
jgi:hypothetical protein